MVETLIAKVRAWLFKGEYAALIRQNEASFARERQLDDEVNRRVASVLGHMDPWEPVMREFGGVFTEDYERPEDRLDERSKILMETFGYQMAHDPSFNHLIDWIVNTQGQAAVKKGDPTDKTILFSRAMIAAPLVVRREVRRLANLYEERMASREEFDETLSTE